MDRHRAALSSLPRWAPAALVALPAVWLGVFFAWPTVTLVGRAGGPQIDADIVWFTLWQAVVSTVLTLALGMVPAYVLARFSFPGRRLVLAVVTVPFMLPTVVVGAAFLALLPDHLHGTTTALVLAHVFFNVAVVVRLVGAMWSVIPHELTGAARTLGASPWQVLRLVVLPLLRPGIVAASTVVFLFTFTSYGAVVLLAGPGHPTVEVEIVRLATQLGDVDRAVALSVVQLVVLALAVMVSAGIQRRASRPLGAVPVRRVARTRRERSLVVTTGAVVAVMMTLPVIALVRRSVVLGGRLTLEAWRSLGHNSGRPGMSLGVDPLGSITASLRIAAAATVLSCAIGLLGALAIGAARRRLAGTLDVGLMLPLGTSAVTVGLGMLITFDHAPFDWRATWWLVPVGHSLIAVPFVVRAVLPVVRSVPTAQLDAAAVLGAGPWRAWWEVVVRRLPRALLVGAGLSAAISLGEFGATTFLTRTGHETVPVAIGRVLARTGELPRAQGFALATLLFLVTAAVVVATDSPSGGQ
ncbi:MAG: ABC transporter permease [Ilumatobacteraceae bacterium]